MKFFYCGLDSIQNTFSPEASHLLSCTPVLEQETTCCPLRHPVMLITFTEVERDEVSPTLNYEMENCTQQMATVYWLLVDQWSGPD